MNPQELAEAAIRLDAEEFEEFLDKLAELHKDNAEEIFDQSGCCAALRANEHLMFAYICWSRRRGN